MFRVRQIDTIIKPSIKGDLKLLFEQKQYSKHQLNQFNTSPFSNFIFIPMEKIITQDQSKSTCISTKLNCKTNQDCDYKIPGILLDGNKCLTIEKNNVNEKQKGCMVYDWCPQENIYSNSSQIINYDNYKNIFIEFESFAKTSLIKLNDYKQSFPSKSANFFQLNVLIEGSGLNKNTINDLGGVINLRFIWECYKFFSYEKCTRRLHMNPLHYEGETIGYSYKTINKDNLEENKRTENHYSGLLIYSSGYLNLYSVGIIEIFYLISIIIIFSKIWSFLLKKIFLSRRSTNIPLEDVLKEKIY